MTITAKIISTNMVMAPMQTEASIVAKNPNPDPITKMIDPTIPTIIPVPIGDKIVATPTRAKMQAEIIITAVGIVVAKIDPPMIAINRINPAVKVKIAEHRKTNAKNKLSMTDNAPMQTSIANPSETAAIMTGQTMNIPVKAAHVAIAPKTTPKNIPMMT